MKKKIRISFNAPVILWFAIICTGATVINHITKGLANQIVFSTYHSSLSSPMTYLRFITHIFGHANWEHLIGNMSYLLLLGPMLEEKYESKTIVQVIAVTAVVTGLINYVFFPSVALCGASGVIFAFILLSSFTSFKEGEIPLTFILVAVFFIGHQIIASFMATDSISNLSHIIGGGLGSIIGYGLNVKSANSFIH